MQFETLSRGGGVQTLSATDRTGAVGSGLAAASVGNGYAVGEATAGAWRGVTGVHAPTTNIARSEPSADVVLDRMEVIGVTSGRPPSVDRPEGSTSVILTIDGLREAKVRDKDTRLRITLQGRQAARLWRLLGERLTDEEKALT